MFIKKKKKGSNYAMEHLTKMGKKKRVNATKIRLDV